MTTREWCGWQPAAAWSADSVSCPRSGELIVRDGSHWYSTGTDFKRPSPQWWFDDDALYGPDGLALPMRLRLPGAVNRGNAAQAVAAAVALGGDPAAAVAAVSTVDEVAGRYRTVTVGQHQVRLLLAKNPAGWQEAMAMVDKQAAGVVISVNGQVPDGEDLSWLWDVRFEHLDDTAVVAAGERGTDLAVRLGYAGVQHTLVHDTLAAIASCPPGRVEVVANYTAFLQLQRRLGRTWLTRQCGSGWCCPTSWARTATAETPWCCDNGCGLRGIAAEIVEITLAEPVPESLDLYTLGGAEDYAQRLATRHLREASRVAASRRTRGTGAGDMRGDPGARTLV